MTVTYQQIKAFRNNARQFLSKKKEQTKLHYALTKMIKRTESHNNEFMDKEAELKIDLAETNKEGHILVDTNRLYVYSKESAKELQKRTRKLQDTEVEIEPYICSELPADLESIWFEFFVPFVIEDKEPD